MKDRVIIFFGAGGAGASCLEESIDTPTVFIDNDETKWGQELAGVEIREPAYLDRLDPDSIDYILLTTGYVKDVMAQLKALGISEEKIRIPPKSWLGVKPFRSKAVRVDCAAFIARITERTKSGQLVAVGGTALGFVRDQDFIRWDFDCDFFAPENTADQLIRILQAERCIVSQEGKSLKAIYQSKDSVEIPISIDFFDSAGDKFTDTYEDYQWIWPTEMFTKYQSIEIHGYVVNVPNPPETYLEGIYGAGWSEPNPDFTYNDYNNGASCTD